MNRVVHFEIQAENTERAMKFYQDVFGWNFQQWGEQKYWMVMTAEKDSKEPGINGGLLPRPASAPTGGCGANAFVCTVQLNILMRWQKNRDERRHNRNAQVRDSRYGVARILYRQ